MSGMSGSCCMGMTTLYSSKDAGRWDGASGETWVAKTCQNDAGWPGKLIGRE